MKTYRILEIVSKPLNAAATKFQVTEQSSVFVGSDPDEFLHRNGRTLGQQGSPFPVKMELVLQASPDKVRWVPAELPSVQARRESAPVTPAIMEDRSASIGGTTMPWDLKGGPVSMGRAGPSRSADVLVPGLGIAIPRIAPPPSQGRSMLPSDLNRGGGAIGPPPNMATPSIHTVNTGPTPNLPSVSELAQTMKKLAEATAGVRADFKAPAGMQAQPSVPTTRQEGEPQFRSDPSMVLPMRPRATTAEGRQAEASAQHRAETIRKAAAAKTLDESPARQRLAEAQAGVQQAWAGMETKITKAQASWTEATMHELAARDTQLEDELFGGGATINKATLLWGEAEQQAQELLEFAQARVNEAKARREGRGIEQAFGEEDQRPEGDVAEIVEDVVEVDLQEAVERKSRNQLKLDLQQALLAEKTLSQEDVLQLMDEPSDEE